MPGLHLGLGLGLQRRVKAAGGGPSPDPLAISGTPVLTATEGEAYDGFTVSASGGIAPYVYSLIGTWPDGIDIDPDTGDISGTPTESGSFTGLSVRVTDATSDTDDLDTFTLTVEAAAATDPHWANVVLLCGFNGSDGATSSSDESSKGHALTFNGNAQLDTAQSKFGGSALLVSAEGDYVRTPDSADWYLLNGGSEPFTVEAFIRPTSFGANRTVVGQWLTTGGQRSWWLGVQASNNASFSRSATGSAISPFLMSGTNTVTANVWSHLAIDFDGTKYRLYVDGVMKASTSDATLFFNSTGALTIGNVISGSQQFVGHIDEVRITKGVARYASDAGFTVPTEAFPRS